MRRCFRALGRQVIDWYSCFLEIALYPSSQVTNMYVMFKHADSFNGHNCTCRPQQEMCIREKP